MAKASGSLCFRSIILCSVGTLVGAAVGGFVFCYHWLGQPHYAARISFLIEPPPAYIGDDHPARLPSANNDMLQVLHRQELIFEQDAFLQDVLKSDEFHPVDPVDAARRIECKWLAENKADPIRRLHRDLAIIPRADAGAFDITMTARDPGEAVSLVMAAGKVYRSFLQGQSDKLKANTLDHLNDALKQAETNFQLKSSEFDEFARRKGIDLAQSRFEIEKSALKSLNEDSINAAAQAAMAEMQLNAMKHLQDGGKPLELPPNLLQQVENDPSLRSLAASRLGWEQEMAAERVKPAPSMDRSREIQSRVDEIDKQAADIRERLKSEALKQYSQQLMQDSASQAARRDYFQTLRDQKEQIVRSIGQDLLPFQQKIDDLKEQQAQLNKMRAEYSLANDNRFLDDTRIQPLIDAPATPDDPVVPPLYWYFPTGAGAGLLLSGVLAMGLAANRRRKMLAAGATIINDPQAPSRAFPIQDSTKPNV